MKKSMRKIGSLIYKYGVLTLTAGGGMWLVGWRFVWDSWIHWLATIAAMIIAFTVQTIIFTRADKFKEAANKKHKL